MWVVSTSLPELHYHQHTPRGASGHVMSKEPSEQSRVVPGQVRLECRVAVWMRCPVCHREHSHVLSAHDNLILTGLRYWRMDCQGTSYFLRLSSTAVASAVAQAGEIAAEHGLSQNWLSGETVETCCVSGRTE